MVMFLVHRTPTSYITIVSLAVYDINFRDSTVALGTEWWKGYRGNWGGHNREVFTGILDIRLWYG